MSTSSAFDEFVKRLKERLAQLLDQNVGKGNYAIDRCVEDRAFSYQGRDMRKGIAISASIGHNINFLLDFFRIIWTSASGYKVTNGQWEEINYPTIFVKVAFSRTSEEEDYYDVPKSQAEKLLDILEKYNWVEGNEHDGILAHANETFEIESPFGEEQTSIIAIRNIKNNMELIRCYFPIDWSNKKWKNYLDNNIVEVPLIDTSSWDAAIDEILNVVVTINADISKYCKDVVSTTLSAFIEKVKERVKEN